MTDTVDSALQAIQFGLTDRIVLVTGGVRGVGAGISRVFTDQGATVVTCARRPVEGLPYEFHSCDIRDDESVKALIAAIVADHGRLDVVVNNAGGSPYALAAQSSANFSRKIVELNLLGALSVSTHANAVMQNQESGGSIVNITSVSGRRPTPGTVAYGAAKAGVESMTSTLAVEWAPKVRVNSVVVGMVETEEYGSNILALGGVNRLTGKYGVAAARAVAAAANRRAVKLKVRGGAKLDVQVGRPPVIGGQEMGRMRVGCGSATAGLFATFFKKGADEVIVLDAHITSLFTHHAAGRYLGARPSGIELVYTLSTPGRYFGRAGQGWGGTDIENPLDIIAGIDRSRTPVGLRLLITETTGQRAALFELGAEGNFTEIPLTPEAEEAKAAIAETCQTSRVSAVYVGGAGGSARAGVARYPLRLTKAVHEGRAVVTVGGAPVFVLPGGGITFYVDVEKVKVGAFTWVPTPATVCPLEYTMTREDYDAMGGHQEAMKPFKAGKPAQWKA